MTDPLASVVVKRPVGVVTRDGAEDDGRTRVVEEGTTVGDNDVEVEDEEVDEGGGGEEVVEEDVGGGEVVVDEEEGSGEDEGWSLDDGCSDVVDEDEGSLEGGWVVETDELLGGSVVEDDDWLEEGGSEVGGWDDSGAEEVSTEGVGSKSDMAVMCPV